MNKQQLGLLKDIWRKLRFEKDVLIAGGAPRNTLTNLPIKDIDIFVPVNYDVSRLMKSLGVALRPMSKAKGYGVQNVVEILEGIDGNGLRYNVIETIKLPRQQVYDFPDDISRMWITGSTLSPGEVVIDYTPEARRAWLSRHITTEDASDKRIARLEELYKPMGWTFTHKTSSKKVVVTFATPVKSKREETPFWWELPYIDPEKAMEQVRLSSGDNRQSKEPQWLT